MEEKAALIHDLDEARQKLQAELLDLDEQMPIYPGWTIKHLLAHLIGWDEASTATLRAYAQGLTPPTLAVGSFDDYNAKSVAAGERLSYDLIAKEWELARDQLKAALLDVPDEKIAEPLLFSWGATGTLRELVTIYAGHEVEHAEELHTLKTYYSRPAQVR
jgi:hypothetical protein